MSAVRATSYEQNHRRMLINRGWILRPTRRVSLRDTPGSVRGRSERWFQSSWNATRVSDRSQVTFNSCDFYFPFVGSNRRDVEAEDRFFGKRHQCKTLECVDWTEVKHSEPVVQMLMKHCWVLGFLQMSHLELWLTHGRSWAEHSTASWQRATTMKLLVRYQRVM